MQLPRTPRAAPRRISLTPLIDIVFILLLFFILESNFLRFGELLFNNPRSEEAGAAPLQAIELQVFANGRIWLEGRSLDTASLDSFLTGSAHDGETPVFVSAEDDLPLQTLVRVVDVLQAHGLANLQLRSLEE